MCRHLPADSIQVDLRTMTCAGLCQCIGEDRAAIMIRAPQSYSSYAASAYIEKAPKRIYRNLYKTYTQNLIKKRSLGGPGP